MQAKSARFSAKTELVRHYRVYCQKQTKHTYRVHSYVTKALSQMEHFM